MSPSLAELLLLTKHSLVPIFTVHALRPVKADPGEDVPDLSSLT